MAQLIKQGALVNNDQWQRIEDDAVMADYSLISLKRWQENSAALAPLAEAGKVGLFLQSEETADLIGNDSRHFTLIAIDFPKFSDGRGYSAARLLRERHGYRGELRAMGDVLIDQLFFMKRCGFDSYALRDDQDLETALAAFSTFTVNYQTDVHEPRPLFRRR
ncbi:DUF934 domain-containing protein [Thalassolituus sp. LLYu03]|uniref:DUF934 domain-containing protein n=1 Tax=Thalassolituus sp. LLYu03 TaxID=3421656 RepID=UPI003D26D8F7